MATEQAIDTTELLREILAASDYVGKEGRIEITIHKTNHVLVNPEIRPTKKRNGKVTLNRDE